MFLYYYDLWRTDFNMYAIFDYLLIYVQLFKVIFNAMIFFNYRFYTVI